MSTRESKTTLSEPLKLKILELFPPEINKVSVALYNPLITIPLFPKFMSVVRDMESKAGVRRAGLNVIVSPALASWAACLREPGPESLVLITVMLI